MRSALALLAAAALAGGCTVVVRPADPASTPPPRPVEGPGPIAVAPVLAGIDGSPVLYVANWPEDVFAYGGRWYRTYRGSWYRAASASGPWGAIPRGLVPRPVLEVPRDFRSRRPVVTQPAAPAQPAVVQHAQQQAVQQQQTTVVVQQAPVQQTVIVHAPPPAAPAPPPAHGATPALPAAAAQPPSAPEPPRPRLGRLPAALAAAARAEAPAASENVPHRPESAPLPAAASTPPLARLEPQPPAHPTPPHGKPEGAGRPDHAAKPEGHGRPESPGRPEGAGKPETPGTRNEGAGQPERHEPKGQPPAHAQARGVRAKTPPPLGVAPNVVPIAGSPVAYADNASEDLFLFEGVWYRAYEGAWYRATAAGGEWVPVAKADVPKAVLEVPADFRARVKEKERGKKKS